MKYKEFIKNEWSNSKAYILGLVFPRIDIGRSTENGNYYLVGQIAHNANMVNDNDIVSHLMNLSKVFKQDGYNVNNLTILNSKVKILKDDYHRGRKNGKKGFVVALLVNSQEDTVIDLRNSINQEMIDMLMKMPDKLIPYFIAGTIDGRSSYDTTVGFVSIDMDRDNGKQTLLSQKIGKYGYNININARDKKHPKADQLRYRPNDIGDIVDNIPLLSETRKRVLEHNRR